MLTEYNGAIPICGYGTLKNKTVYLNNGICIHIENWYQFTDFKSSWFVIEQWAWGLYITHQFIADKL